MRMSVEQTFLDAIRQEPDEMVHRLAFTDWLEDREDPRAELIRIHLELDEIPEYARHISDPIFRKRLWWREHAAHWLNTFPDVEPIHCWCERGVPEDAQFENFKTFQRIGAEWLACTAIHRVQFRTLTGCKMLARMRLLQQVTELMMDRPGLRSHALNVLFKSENINNLRRLSVTSSELDPSTARAIRDCPHLGNLRGLDLSHNAIKDEGVAYLAQFPGQLQSLALRRVGLTNQGIQALVDSTLVEGLEQLDLNFNDLGDEAVALLAECESLTNLTNLEISDCRLSAKGVKSLCESKHLSHLKRLDLRSNDIAEGGVSMISEATFLPGL